MLDAHIHGHISSETVILSAAVGDWLTAVMSLLRLILVGAQSHLSSLNVAAALALAAAGVPALAAAAAVAAVATQAGRDCLGAQSVCLHLASLGSPTAADLSPDLVCQVCCLCAQL